MSIIQRDGGHFEFAHRSFQEYFYAKFAVTDRNYSLREKLSEMGLIWVFDDTLSMIAEMDSNYFADDFLLPEAIRLKSELSNIDISQRPSSVLIKFFDRVKYDPLDKDEPTVKYYTSIDQRNMQKSLNRVIWHYARARPSIKDKILLSDRRPDPRDDELSKKSTSVTIHHMNDEKLLRLGCDAFADDVRVAINLLVEELQKSMQSRQSMLASRMRAAHKRKRT